MQRNKTQTTQSTDTLFCFLREVLWDVCLVFGYCALCIIMTFMSRNYLLNAIAILVCAIAALHFLAINYYLYWMFWWYDIILHFLGGVFSGLFVLWLRYFSGYLGAHAVPTLPRVFLFVGVSVLIVGIGWEVFEWVVGETFRMEGYWKDTIVDVVLDLLGGIAAAGLFQSSHKIYGHSA